MTISPLIESGGSLFKPRKRVYVSGFFFMAVSVSSTAGCFQPAVPEKNCRFRESLLFAGEKHIMPPMASIAKVVVDITRDREFDYLIPRELRDQIRLGSRVLVPFRSSRKIGCVVGLASDSPRGNLKEVIEPVGDRPFIRESLLELARWMASYYCAPVEHAIRTMLPGAVRRRGAAFRKQKSVRLVEEEKNLQEDRKGKGSGTKGEKAGKAKRLTEKQEKVLEVLERRKEMLLRELTREAETTVSPVKSLEKKGLVRIEDATMLRSPLASANILRTGPLKLMPEQEEALEKIIGSVEARVLQEGREEREGRGGEEENPDRINGIDRIKREREESGAVLLYGVTGSGKTEVYLQAIDCVLSKGKGAIVLVPEISLTPQTVERFVSRFGGRVAVLHSHLSDGERHDEWHRIRDGRADIVIGARSAVFAPLANPGLIVVDEEHEPSYKQGESPRYSARDVAVMRGKLENCAVVLGSATPSLESWNNAGKGKYALAVLPRRADNRKMPRMRVIDMRIEMGRPGRGGVFSRELLDAIQQRLEKGEQTILFLNRRGFATSLICPRCGYVAECGQCSVSYTYHRKDERLRCHICGAVKKVPAKCPGCGDPAFRFAGVGTQRIESIARKCFPRASIQRMDADVTGRKDAYGRILGDFRVGKTDILIGTQMIAKGLHFPNVTLVGVMYADLSLHMPDFRAGERTFQLLAQVAGRAGRGEVSGEVIVQTYTPFHAAVQAARRQDYAGFGQKELESRRELCYPPFARLTCITFKGRSERETAFYASALAKKLQPCLDRSVRMSRPVPAPLAKAKGKYRYQLMLRSPRAASVTHPVSAATADFKLPRGMSMAVDVDALNLM
ncbi:MAG: primosomal protein N' [Kiritimatiellia bacterium]